MIKTISRDVLVFIVNNKKEISWLSLLIIIAWVFFSAGFACLGLAHLSVNQFYKGISARIWLPIVLMGSLLGLRFFLWYFITSTRYFRSKVILSGRFWMGSKDFSIVEELLFCTAALSIAVFFVLAALTFLGHLS